MFCSEKWYKVEDLKGFCCRKPYKMTYHLKWNGLTFQTNVRCHSINNPAPLRPGIRYKVVLAILLVMNLYFPRGFLGCRSRVVEDWCRRGGEIGKRRHRKTSPRQRLQVGAHDAPLKGSQITPGYQVFIYFQAIYRGYLYIYIHMIYIRDTANGEFIEDQKHVPKWQKLMQVENNCRSWQFGLSRCGQSYLHGLSQKIDCSQIMNLARCILLDGSIFVCHGIWLRFDTLVQGCVTDASPSGNVAGLLSEHLQDFVSWVPFCMEKHLTIASPAFFLRGLHQTVMENQAAISAPKICLTSRIEIIRWGWTLGRCLNF